MYLGITAVEPLPDFQLLLTFENAEQRLFDVKPLLSTGLFSQLRDERLFRSVTVRFDTIEWSNGTDLDPEMLYHKSTAQTMGRRYGSKTNTRATSGVKEPAGKRKYRRARTKKARAPRATRPPRPRR